MQDEKRSFTLCSISVLTATLLFIFCSVLIYAYYKYTFNVDQSYLEFSRFAHAGREWVNPEPWERGIYLFSIVFFPLFFLGAFIFGIIPKLNSFLENEKRRNFLYYLIIPVFSLILALSLQFSHNVEIHKYDWQYYWKYTFLGQSPLLFLLFILPLIIFMVFRYNPSSRIHSTIASTVTWIAASLLSLLSIPMSIFSISFNQAISFHVPPVVEPIVALSDGLATNLDVISLYGFYSYFLEPLMRLTGFSTVSFTAIMGVLISISIFATFLFYRQITRNKLLLLLAFMSMIFFNYFLSRANGDNYFQWYPIRTFIPSLVTLFAVLFFLKKSTASYYIAMVLSPISVIWNTETGVVISLTWLSALLYFSFLKSELKIKRGLRLFGFHFLKFMASNIIILLAFIIYFHARHDRFPSMELPLMINNAYMKYGYYMLSMPLLRPWNIFALTYIVGLFLSVYLLFSRKMTSLATLIFFNSVYGIGLFGYYQGRSHDTTLLNLVVPFFALLMIYADSLLKTLKKNGSGYISHVYIFCFILFLFSLGATAFFTPKFITRIHDRISERIHTVTTNPTHEWVEILDRHTAPNERVLVISYPAATLLLESHARYATWARSFCSNFFWKQIDMLNKGLENNHSDKVFLFNAYMIAASTLDILDKKYRKTILKNHPSGLLRNQIIMYEPKQGS